MSDVSARSGFSIDVEKNTIAVTVKTKLFPLEVIYSASYMQMDTAYVFLDGDPDREVIVCFTGKKPLTEKELEILGREFHNELLNYAVYVTQAARNKGLREAIIKRALYTNSTEYDVIKATQEPAVEKDDFLEDPEGIAKPWTPPESTTES